MKNILPIFSFLLIHLCYSQKNNHELIELQGLTMSTIESDTIALAIIEIWNDSTLIANTTSDLSGHFILNLCSGEFSTDSIEYRVFGLYHQVTVGWLKLENNNCICIKLEPDTLKIIDREYLLNKNYESFLACGTDEYNFYQETNPDFIHCDGTIKSFKSILKEQGNLIGWKLYKQK